MRSIGPAVTREQSPAFLRNSTGRLDLPGPTQEAACNDIEMLQFAGIGVAMGNAGDSVKAAADYVTDTVDDCGIEKALRYFGLIE